MSLQHEQKGDCSYCTKCRRAVEFNGEGWEHIGSSPADHPASALWGPDGNPILFSRASIELMGIEPLGSPHREEPDPTNVALTPQIVGTCAICGGAIERIGSHWGHFAKYLDFDPPHAIYPTAPGEITPREKLEAAAAGIDWDDPVHCLFGLSYGNYFVAPRSILQSMPIEWQQRFALCMVEYRQAVRDLEDLPDTYWVRARASGFFTADPYSDYERGRRKVELRRINETSETEQ